MKPLYCNRSRQCNCCGEKIRIRVRVGLVIGDYKDPDYQVAICPKCDGGKKK